jgi:hypothetical protein
MRSYCGPVCTTTAPTRGSAFHFTVKVHPATSICATPCLREAPGQPAPARSLKVLLAEDNCANQMVRLLERSGHTVSVAANGRDAVNLFEKYHYDARVESESSS